MGQARNWGGEGWLALLSAERCVQATCLSPAQHWQGRPSSCLLAPDSNLDAHPARRCSHLWGVKLAMMEVGYSLL